MIDKDCPECHGTGQYVGFNKVEPCSICKVYDSFEHIVPIYNLVPTTFEYLVKLCNLHFGKQYEKQFAEYLVKLVEKENMSAALQSSSLYAKMSHFLDIRKTRAKDQSCNIVKFKVCKNRRTDNFYLVITYK